MVNRNLTVRTRRDIVSLGVLIALASLTCPWNPHAVAAEGQSPTGTIVAKLGDREVVLSSGQHGLTYFPDMSFAVIGEKPAYRILLAAGTSTRLLEGKDMLSLKPVGEVLKPGKKGSFDNGYAGIGSVIRDPDSNQLWAFYHAEDQEGLPEIGGGIPGFYSSVGLAVSKDDGRTFEKKGGVIASQVPKSSKGFADQGCGEMSVLADRNREYLLAYYTDHSRVDGRGVQIFLARCPLKDKGVPGSWKKYHDGKFDEPGLGGKDSPIVSASAMKADAIFPHVTYVGKLDRYIMVYNINAYLELAPGTKLKDSGFYLAYSQDGIHWPRPKQLAAVYSIPLVDKEIACHPTLLVTDVEGKTAKGWLHYGFSERWGHKAPQKPHYLVRQPIEFSFQDK